MIKNPFIESSPVTLEREIAKDLIIKQYKEGYGIDLDEFLQPVEKIQIYKCANSGYRFYYPHSIAGDSRFYEALQKNDWYYMPWKWEHEVCRGFIKEGDNILEVGCGKGDFLKNISSNYSNVQLTGLELNKTTASDNEKYKIINSNIEEYSEYHKEEFDMVCSFQVLEHIAMVNSFLEASIACLKKGGHLLISVPNNKSFIKYDPHNVLNMPPHHMGLWDQQSLEEIGKKFNLEVEKIYFEPLQAYHFDWYINLLLMHFAGRRLSSYLKIILFKLKLRPLIMKYLEKRAHKIKGHSILIVLKK